MKRCFYLVLALALLVIAIPCSVFATTVYSVSDGNLTKIVDKDSVKSYVIVNDGINSANCTSNLAGVAKSIISHDDVSDENNVESSVTYAYDSKTKTLTFSGNGMVVGPQEYAPFPWHVYADVAETIVLENGITGLGNFVFQDFARLTEVVFPDEMSSIGQQVFFSCTSLREVNLPDGITFYDVQIFDFCTSLETVTFGSTPEGVYVYALDNMFSNCTSLKDIYVPSDNKIYHVKDGVLFAGNALMCYPPTLKNTEYSIPEGTIEIVINAFSKCNNLEYVTIPNSVQIVSRSFESCSQLKEIVIPESVEIFRETNTIAGSCKNLITITNNSSVEMPLEPFYEHNNGHPYWIYWKDKETGEFISSISNGTAISQRLGHYLSKGEHFELNGVTYRVLDAAKELDASDMNEKKAVATLMIVDHISEAEPALKIQYEGRYYDIVNPLSEHEYGKLIVEKKPTCTRTGEGEKACNSCDSRVKEKIPAKGHKYETSYTVDKAASTTKNGSKSKHCENCVAKKDIKTIYKASTVKLKTTTYSYNRKVKAPSVIIKDSKGNTISTKNYTIKKPDGRKNVGKYTYKVTFKNEYKGTKSLYLTINPKATSITPKPTASKKGFTLKWKKVTEQATGYEIMYSTSKNFAKKTSNTVKIKSYKTTSKKITKLESKKTYYVKVRTYKTVDGMKYYSKWSEMKSVKTR